MPIVSKSANPEWNQHSIYYLKNLLSFADANLNDDGIILLMHLNDLELTKDIHGCAFTFENYLAKD